MTIKYIEETAVFANSDATVILVTVEEDGEVRNMAIEVGPNPVYNDFHEHIKLDTVYQNTVEREKELSKADEEYRQFHLEELKKFVVEEFAETLGERIKKDIYKDLNLSELVSNSSLIDIKFELFAIEAIKNSKNTDLKKSLRKSITVLEAVSYAIAIIVEENKK